MGRNSNKENNNTEKNKKKQLHFKGVRNKVKILLGIHYKTFRKKEKMQKMTDKRPDK